MGREPLSKAVILCAGLGTRLMPLTRDCPKVMLPVKGKPLLEHHIAWLRTHGIQDIFINLHHQAGAVVGYFGDGGAFGVRITYSIEERLRGTGGALNAFRGHLRGAFLVHYGDVYTTMDLGRFYSFHCGLRGAATLVVHPASHAHDTDIVQLDCNSRVVAVRHKPGSLNHGNLGNAACYLLEEKVLEYVDRDAGSIDFIRDVFPAMIASGELLGAYNTDELLYDMGTHERYLRLQEALR